MNRVCAAADSRACYLSVAKKWNVDELRSIVDIWAHSQHTIAAKERAKTKKQGEESQEEDEKFNRNLLINVVELKPQIIVVCLFFFFSLATAALVAR